MITMKFVLIHALLLAGCASSFGAKQITDEKVVAQIEKGKSTKADVEKLLGKPASVDFTDAGFEKWFYAHTWGLGQRAETLTVRFTAEGIVDRIGKGETGGTPPRKPAQPRGAYP